MAAPVVTVEGLKRLARTLKEFGEGLEDLKDANAAASATVAREAQGRAPRRSGALAASVRGTRQQGKASIRVGSAKVPYAGPIHWGWPARGIPRRPFVIEAAEATEASWLAEYEAAIRRLADSVEGV